MIINFSTGAVGVPRREARGVSARVPAGSGGAEHGLDELREVLALAAGLRLQDGLCEPLRGDHRAASRRCASWGSSRSTSASTLGHVGSLWPLDRHGPPRAAAARGLHHGRARRDPAERAQPGGDGRRTSPARAGPSATIPIARGAHWAVIGISREQWMLVAAALLSAARCARASRTTSTCRTGAWRARTAS